MTNNFQQIASLLKFEDENEFYFVQIIQRKKEHAELGRNNRMVQAYYIYSLNHLEKVREEIMGLCMHHDARAYIHLNRRNSKKIAFEMLELLSKNLKGNDFNQLHKLYSSVCGQHHSDKDKTWILDVDTKDDGKVDEVVRFVNQCTQPNGEKIIATIPTKNGVHIITKPFDPRSFGTNFPEVEIHKNNPTILFCL